MSISHYKKPVYRNVTKTMRVFIGYEVVRTNWLCILAVLFLALYCSTKIVSSIPEYETTEMNLVHETKEVNVTMYNLGDPRQTDVDSPCVGATGVDLCQLKKYINICASNCYPLGTKLEVVGLGECIVLDRMNKRYSCETLDWAVPLGEKTYSLKTNIKTL